LQVEEQTNGVSISSTSNIKGPRGLFLLQVEEQTNGVSISSTIS